MFVTFFDENSNFANHLKVGDFKKHIQKSRI
jgi:hypothetical protein